MLNKINTAFINTHAIGKIFKLGQKKLAWKKVVDLACGMKIASEKNGKLDWDEIVSIKKVKSKEDVQERKLTDGRKFIIYKRYFDEKDLYKIAEKNGFRILDIYFGEAFLAFKACFGKR